MREGTRRIGGMSWGEKEEEETTQGAAEREDQARMTAKRAEEESGQAAAAVEAAAAAMLHLNADHQDALVTHQAFHYHVQFASQILSATHLSERQLV